MKDVVTYLNFDGQTKEAMEFYAKALGGELFLMKGGDIPGSPARTVPPIFATASCTRGSMSRAVRS